MSPIERLNAAADRLEGAMQPAEDCGLPWRTDDHEIVSTNSIPVVSNIYGPDANLIVTAVNAMPTVAAWLRETARAYPSDQAVDHPALTLAYQILGKGDR